MRKLWCYALALCYLADECGGYYTLLIYFPFAALVQPQVWKNEPQPGVKRSSMTITIIALGFERIPVAELTPQTSPTSPRGILPPLLAVNLGC